MLSFVVIMMECYVLQHSRRASGLFAGKQGYMTLRDLFRWAERFRLADDNEKVNGKQLLAENGITVILLSLFNYLFLLFSLLSVFVLVVVCQLLIINVVMMMIIIIIKQEKV